MEAATCLKYPKTSRTKRGHSLPCAPFISSTIVTRRYNKQTNKQANKQKVESYFTQISNSRESTSMLHPPWLSQTFVLNLFGYSWITCARVVKGPSLNEVGQPEHWWTSCGGYKPWSFSIKSHSFTEENVQKYISCLFAFGGWPDGLRHRPDYGLQWSFGHNMFWCLQNYPWLKRPVHVLPSKMTNEYHCAHQSRVSSNQTKYPW